MTKTREKNIATNENCILRKMGLKFQKPKLQYFMQNSILEQAKVTEQGADYMERVAQVKRQPV